MERIRLYIPYLKPYRWEITIGVIALLATDVLGLVIPWLVKQVVDLLPSQPEESELLRYAGWLFLASIGQGIARFGWRKYFFGPSRKMELDILNHLFSHLLTLDKTYFQKNKVGDLMSRATNDLRAVKEFLGLGLLVVVDAVVVITACVSLMIYINPTLTFYALMPLPILSILFFTFIRSINVRHTAIQENLARITSMVQENLAGIRVLHAFVQEKSEIRRFDHLNKDHIEKNMSLAKLFGFFTPSLVFVVGIAAMIALWIGGKDVIAGRLSLGSFVAFNSYLMMLSWPMMAIGYMINLTQKGTVAMDRLQEIMKARPSLHLAPPSKEVFEVQGDIEYRNLSFTYPESGTPVFENFNVHVRQGERVAIIGMIGAGKSSLLQLLPRVYDATPGSILIDGRPVTDFPPEALRQSIGYVEQEPFMFSASIRDNIALARPGVSDAEIDAMIQCVHLTPDLERLPNGLDTIVGERGVSVSGGQKQRIALARALIRKPKILILDDAFSSLDVETEKIILGNIQEVTRGMTLLVVTHRLSLARSVDRILVLDQGRIAEEGTHDALIKSGGLYQKIFNNQALAREMEILLQ